MKLKKMIKRIEEMRVAGMLPDLNTETIELPFGAKLVIVKHPALHDDNTIKENITGQSKCDYLKYAVFHPFVIGLADPLVTKREDHEVRISGLTRKEAEEICDHINQSVIEIKP